MNKERKVIEIKFIDKVHYDSGIVKEVEVIHHLCPNCENGVLKGWYFCPICGDKLFWKGDK